MFKLKNTNNNKTQHKSKDSHFLLLRIAWIMALIQIGMFQKIINQKQTKIINLLKHQSRLLIVCWREYLALNFGIWADGDEQRHEFVFV